MTKVRNKFDRMAVRYVPDKSAKVRVKQAFRKDCDINILMGKYAKGQIVDHLAKWEGSFGDFPAMDFQQAMDLVARAQEMFDDLPSEVRSRFGNNPTEFLTFANAIEDGKLKNIDELRRLGLAKPAEPAEPSAVERRVGELETDRQARLEVARRALKEPPGDAHTSVS